jgi:hypothetical protein
MKLSRGREVRPHPMGSGSQTASKRLEQKSIPAGWSSSLALIDFLLSGSFYNQDTTNHEATDSSEARMDPKNCWVYKMLAKCGGAQDISTWSTKELSWGSCVANSDFLFTWSLTLSPIHNKGNFKPATNFSGRRRQAQYLVP